MTTLLSRIPRLELESIGMIDGCDAVNRTTTVCGSGATTSAIPSTRNFVVELRLITRSSDHFTSADVSKFPLTNFTLGRSLNVYARPSAETLQLMASDGLGFLRSSPLKVTSES